MVNETLMPVLGLGLASGLVQFLSQPCGRRLERQLFGLGLAKAKAVLFCHALGCQLIGGLAGLVEIDQVGHGFRPALARGNHGFGPDDGVEFGIGHIATANRFFAQGRSILMRGLGNLGCIVIANLGRKSGHQH